MKNEVRGIAEMTLSEELEWRGFINQTTYKDVSIIDGDSINFYWGVDPSAPSMTVGNLAIAMMVRHFIKYGHNAYLLVGGATGLIGDPDGKKEERAFKSIEEIENNKNAITLQYKQLFGDFTFNSVDNYDWFKNLGYLQFLREVGTHVPMRQMLGRDFVQTRLGESGSGLNYSEFSYVLIQAYDFLHLHRESNVTLQVCGSDQWGNCIAGVDLIRRITGNEANVWSAPLIVNKSTGAKFGKSENGAVWLDANLTSVYDFYQFWLNSDDDSVTDYLKIYTLLSKEEIDEVLKQFNEDKSSRVAQKTLAYEITKFVHGEVSAQQAQRVTSFVTGNKQIIEDNIAVIADSLGKTNISDSVPLANNLLELGLAVSMTEANRLIKEGAIYANNLRLPKDKQSLEKTDFLNNHIVIRRGKNQVAVGYRSTENK